MSLLPMPSTAELLALAESRKAERTGRPPGMRVPPLPLPLPTPAAPVVAAARTNVAYTQRRAGVMNKTERRYSEALEARRLAGEVARWDYEPMKLRLADRAWWTPDFRVVLTDGTVELHEVKGRKGSSYYATEKARLKLRLAAELHPFRILVVWPLAGGDWGRQPIAPLPDAREGRS